MNSHALRIMLLGSAAVVSLLVLSCGGGDSGPNIHPSSCGGWQGVENEYCSFETTGEQVTIGEESCMVTGSCIGLGKASIGSDSCNGLGACSFAGAESGSSSISDHSCNGDAACANSGRKGKSSIGSGSCNARAQEDVNSLVEGTLLTGACSGAGGGGGESAIESESCNAHRACFSAGSFVRNSSRIGSGSCNGFESCWSAGSSIDSVHPSKPSVSSTIRDNSCNKDDACRENQGTVPNNSRND